LVIIRSSPEEKIMGRKALYKITRTQSIAPTMMLAVKVKSPDPDLVTAGVAPEEPLVAVPVGAELETAELEAAKPVDVAEAVAVLYKSELLYVVQELVAGITGSPPGAFWFSPSQTVNSLGLYDAGILKPQPCVS